MKNPTALETMKNSLRMLQQAQALCVDQYDIVKPYMRYRYQMLTREISDLYSSINKLNEIKERGYDGQ